MRELLEVEWSRIPGTIIADADRLESLLFGGYDPYFGCESGEAWQRMVVVSQKLTYQQQSRMLDSLGRHVVSADVVQQLLQNVVLASFSFRLTEGRDQLGCRVVVAKISGGGALYRLIPGVQVTKGDSERLRISVTEDRGQEIVE